MSRADTHEESLPLRGLHALAPWAWRGLVLGVVLLATYVAVGRYFMLQLQDLREPLLDQLNRRLPFTVEAQSLRGGWSAFSPVVEFSDLRLVPGDSDEASVALTGGSLRLDAPASVASRSLQLSRLEIAGLELDAALLESGAIELRGFRTRGGTALRAWLETFLPNVQRVVLRDSRLRLETPAGRFDLTLDVALDRDGNSRRLQGRLAGQELDLAFHAEGVGNPLRPQSWSGDVFVEAASPHLEAFDEAWTLLEWPVQLAGEASVRFWLARSGGDSSATVYVDAQALRLEERGGAWSLPIDALAFEAALTQKARHWSLLTEDFHVERAGQVVDLDRAQFDWWGKALRVRVSDLELDALPALLAAAPGIPEGLRGALPDLAPRGHLDSIELRLDDLSRPAQSWYLRSSLEDVAVSTWRAAPSIGGISGYLELDPNGGSLKLDSADFTTLYPGVYREAQRYDDAVGELRIAWDREALQISSGLLRLRGDEGEARGLLGLSVPLSPRDTGTELELLIGLANSDAAYRDRYLPYRLPEPLLDWLSDSIVTAGIDKAAFVWRGSTRKGREAHRSLQLFVGVDDAVLAYDPAWPRLEALTAAVWVDENRTYATGAAARSAGAELRDLAVRVLPSQGRALLNVSGGVSGDASAAEVLLRDSPLATLTDGLFADWAFSGAVAGDLGIALELGEGAGKPFVELNLTLVDAAATVAQAKLPLTELNGELRYRSDAGFAGSVMTFAALGGGGEAEARPASEGALDLNLRSEVTGDAVAAWLDLPFLNFAQGTAALEGSLAVNTAGVALLHLESDLEGVALDVPAPYRKAAEQPLALRVQMELKSDPRLDLALGERLEAALDFRGDRLERTAARLGGGAPDLASCDQRYCLEGQISSADIAAWADFQARYFAMGEAPASEPGGEDEPFSYRIDSLRVGELAIDGRNFGAARLDLWGIDRLWQGAVEAPWVQGSLTRDGADLHLLLERLDLDGFGGDEPVALAEFLDLLPPMRVDVLDLYSGERRLGEVGFDLDPRPEEGALYAADIGGTLWEARLAEPQAGLLRWSGADGVEATELEVDAAFGDLGRVIAAAGFTPSLESDHGRAAFRLQWPGQPSQFEAALASGTISLSAERGRVLESRPGPLALIGFFNFAEIVRGLSLTHVFESGIPFETASAELHLHAGTVEVAELQIDGAASAFSFTGISDLTQGEVDGELVVTLPVANNLPWVAALAGGLPVAAGVFVVSKVFEKQVNRMSSAVYGVSGDIDSPDVEFRRLFDDQLTPNPPAPGGTGTGDD
jgi:uncharacterized protein (TIGR02099 family)